MEAMKAILGERERKKERERERERKGKKERERERRRRREGMERRDGRREGEKGKR